MVTNLANYGPPSRPLEHSGVQGVIVAGAACALFVLESARMCVQPSIGWNSQDRTCFSACRLEAAVHTAHGGRRHASIVAHVANIEPKLLALIALAHIVPLLLVPTENADLAQVRMTRFRSVKQSDSSVICLEHLWLRDSTRQWSPLPVIRRKRTNPTRSFINPSEPLVIDCVIARKLSCNNNDVARMK